MHAGPRQLRTDPPNREEQPGREKEEAEEEGGRDEGGRGGRKRECLEEPRG